MSTVADELLANWTPTLIDQAVVGLQHRIQSEQASARQALGYLQEERLRAAIFGGKQDSPERRQQAQDALNAALDLAHDAQDEVDAYEAEWERRQWSRAWRDGVGGIHLSRTCSTLTDPPVLVPDLSGVDAATVSSLVGAAACAECFGGAR